MTTDYESLKRFVQRYIIDADLRFNRLETTRSAVLAIIKKFEDLGWSSEQYVDPRTQKIRHRLKSPDCTIVLSMNNAKVFRHPMHTEQICQRKNLTKKMLEFDNLPTPIGADFDRTERSIAKAYFSKLPKPVVIKPTNSGGSKGVTVGVNDMPAFDMAWKHAINEGGNQSNILVEQFVRGIELRALVVGDEAVSIVARIQPFVVGDGSSTLDELIAYSNVLRQVHYRAMQLPVVIDWAYLDRQGYVGDSIPSSDEIVFLHQLALPAYGALLVDVTDSVADSIKELAVRARRSIPDLEVGGIDILVEKLSDPRTAVILEVNTAPSLNLHRYATHGRPREVVDDIVNYFHTAFISNFSLA